jgi:hypothetical protein
VNEKKTIRIWVAIIVIAAVFLGGGLISYCDGASKRNVARDIYNSARVAEHSRLTGEATEFARAIGDGISTVQGSLGSIRSELTSNTSDIRGLAARLYTIGEIVEEMENDLFRLRGSVDMFIGDITDDYTAYEVEEYGP